MEAKYCTDCKKLKPLAAFDVAFQNVNARNGYKQRESRKSRCKACYAVRVRVRARANFIRLYGGKCSCCPENDIRFLTLDHINNDGNTHRETLRDNQILADAITNYQPEKYQILCYNCNMGRQANGGICPHKSISKEEYTTYVDTLFTSTASQPLSPEAKTETIMRTLVQKIDGKKISIEELMKLLVK